MSGNGNPPPGESGLYNRIAVLRAERGISRQDLADAVGVNYQTIGFLERGDYGPSLKLAFSVTLGGGARTDCESWYILLEPLEKPSH